MGHPEDPCDHRSSRDGAEKRPSDPYPGRLDPIDYVRIVGTWIITAIVVVIAVWLGVFGITRGDALGYSVLAGVLIVVSVVIFARRRRR